jgi:hypothetical protein
MQVNARSVSRMSRQPRLYLGYTADPKAVVRKLTFPQTE